jgi:hypothetical protein
LDQFDKKGEKRPVFTGKNVRGSTQWNSGGFSEVLGTELLHPRARGVRAGQRNARHRPEHVEVVTAVPAVAFRPVRGNTHPGEVFGTLGLAERVEQNCPHATLAVVFVALDPWSVIAVRETQ